MIEGQKSLFEEKVYIDRQITHNCKPISLKCFDFKIIQASVVKRSILILNTIPVAFAQGLQGRKYEYKQII